MLQFAGGASVGHLGKSLDEIYQRIVKLLDGYVATEESLDAMQEALHAALYLVENVRSSASCQRETRSRIRIPDHAKAMWLCNPRPIRRYA